MNEKVLRIQDQIQEKGLFEYLEPILDKIHNGSHENIYKALLGMCNVMRGEGSFFITPVSNTMNEYCSEVDIALKMIPQEYVLRRDKETHASFTRMAEQDTHYYDHKIYDMRGQVGQNKSYDQKDLINAMCSLVTEGEYIYGLTGRKDGKQVPTKRELFTESFCVLFPTVTPAFLEKNHYLDSRSLKLVLS